MQNYIVPMDCLRIITSLLPLQSQQNMACTCSQLSHFIIDLVRKKAIFEINDSAKILNLDPLKIYCHYKDLQVCDSLKFIQIIKVSTLSKCFYPLYKDEIKVLGNSILDNFKDLNTAFLDSEILLASLSDENLPVQLFEILCTKKKIGQALDLAAYTRECSIKGYGRIIAKCLSCRTIENWLIEPSISNHYLELALYESIQKNGMSYKKILNKITAQYIEIHENFIVERLYNLNEIYKFFPQRFRIINCPLEKTFSDLLEIFTQLEKPLFAAVCLDNLKKINGAKESFVVADEGKPSPSFNNIDFRNRTYKATPNRKSEEQIPENVEYILNTLDKCIANSLITELLKLPKLIELLRDFKIKASYVEKICSHFLHPYEFNEFIWQLSEEPLIAICAEKLCKFHIAKKQFDEATQLIDLLADVSTKSLYIGKIGDFYFAEKQFDKVTKLFEKYEIDLKYEESFFKLKSRVDLLNQAAIFNLNQESSQHDELRFSYSKKLVSQGAISLALDLANKIFTSNTRNECIEYLFIALKLSSEDFYQYLDILNEMEDTTERREFLRDTVGY